MYSSYCSLSHTRAHTHTHTHTHTHAVSDIHDGPGEEADGAGGVEDAATQAEERPAHRRAAVPAGQEEEEERQEDQESELGSCYLQHTIVVDLHYTALYMCIV